jgi:hypothetical protein
MVNVTGLRLGHLGGAGTPVDLGAVGELEAVNSSRLEEKLSS